MQVYVEIILVAILVVILFNGSITGLKEFANSVLGKAVMVCLIIFISHQFGTNAGLLMAGITIILLHNNIEGFIGKEGIAPAKDGACEEGDENCTDATGYFRNAQPITGSQSGRQDPDKAPGAETDSEKRQGKINGNGKRLGKKFAKEKKKLGQEEKQPAKPVEDKKKEDKKPVEEDKKKEDKKKEEEEEESKKEKEKEGKKGFESFSNYTLDNAADYTNLGSTLAAYSTNDNIMASMRASEYAKTAPGGCALMTNHIDTMRIVNNPGSQGIL